MDGVGLGIILAFVVFLCQVAGWIVRYFFRQRKYERQNALIIHLAKHGLYWNAERRAYLDVSGNRATGEQLREGMKGF